jgi:hypothetical protein
MKDGTEVCTPSEVTTVFLEDMKMNRVVTLSIALFVAIVGLSLISSEASACRLFHWGGGHHGCCGAQVSYHCGGCNQGCHQGCNQGCGQYQGGCGHHGCCGQQGNCGNCGGYSNGGAVIQEQGGAPGADVPEAPPAAEPKAAEPKETSIRSNRFFRTASFRR